jgi:hypothetical protein
MTTDKFLSDVTIWIMGLYLHSSEENDEELNLISSQRVGSLQSFDETSAWLGFKQSIARITDDNEHNFISITVTRGAVEGGVYIGPSLGQWEGMEIIASKKYARYAPPPTPFYKLHNHRLGWIPESAAYLHCRKLLFQLLVAYR